MENVVSSATVLWLAFAAAFVFGAIGQKTHFCTMGAVSDIVNMGDWSRMRMWLLAIGVAILGAGSLELAGLIDLVRSGDIGRESTVLYAHLGGQPAINAYHRLWN